MAILRIAVQLITRVVRFNFFQIQLVQDKLDMRVLEMMKHLAENSAVRAKHFQLKVMQHSIYLSYMYTYFNLIGSGGAAQIS